MGNQKEGVILIDKPIGPSSFDVVRTVRKRCGVKRIGHAGTLDPKASGLMVLCLGRYTKLAGLLTDHDKVYDASFRLGISTTTDDAEGSVIEERDTAHITCEAIEQALAACTGEIFQTPPRFSAIKINGERAYAKARADEEFSIAQREVTIFSISNVTVSLPEISLRIHCSKGTYIRSLARDVGMRLGVGAHASAIRRIRSGGFSIDDAVTLADVSDNAKSIPLLTGSQALSHVPLIAIDEAARNEFRFGRNPYHGQPLASDIAVAMHHDEPIAIVRSVAGVATLARVM